MSSGGGRLLGYSIVGLCTGVYLFYTGFKFNKEKKLIEDTPTSKIRAIAMGRVEIIGKVLADRNHLIRSPFSNQSCVYCKWTIEEYRSSGKSSRWVTVESGTTGDYFFVKDDTGIVIVNPKDADLEIPVDYQFETGIGTAPNEYTKAFVERRGIDYKGLIFNKKMRFREYFLAHNDPIYILGTAGKNPFADNQTSNDSGIMIQKGGKDAFFYIADKGEKDILGNFNWKIQLGFFGGGGLIVLCLFFIFWYFGIL